MIGKIFISYTVGTSLFFYYYKKLNKPFDVYISKTNSYMSFLGGTALTFFILYLLDE
jgi:hypothetical protein